MQSGALAQPPADDDDVRRDTPAAACRLAMYALVRLKVYPQLAAAVLEPNGQPRLRWWPVAFALQRLEDKRALPALLTLAKDAHPYTRAFAVKGLAALRDRAALPVLMPLLSSGERSVLIETIRALGRSAIHQPPSRCCGWSTMRAPIRTCGSNRSAPWAASADAGHRAGPARLAARFVERSEPAIRAAALRSLSAIDPENFVIVLSGLDPDPHWNVRAALAAVLGTLTLGGRAAAARDHAGG